MSLPPGFLDELRTRTSLSQVVGRKVLWDMRKSNQGKGDWWAPCPFHQEKTASFHVDDRKGFYYCFGCHAKGDALSFVRETENVGFMEAVEILAREAGMQMPERDPRAREKADRNAQLAEVMEQAVRHFRMQLATAAAGPARDYLGRRGLDAAAQERWEVGYAPRARQGLYTHLTGKGVDPGLVIEAGLAAKPDDGGAPYDRFRDRIVFPIRDARGRCIAFGGRAMEGNPGPKYLNSPDTPLFDKGRTLFNHGPAREAAGKGQPVIVAEGYMDVIALVQAGFGGAVAPLGTAITEHQLDMLWRVAAEPVVALDGDAAGIRAAMRLIDLALPKLEAGRSLRFCLMPPGQDPDDVIRGGGAPAMAALLDRAEPLVALLWRRETEGRVFDSPERKAALDKALREAIRKIPDPSLRRHYGDEVNRLRWELFRPRRAEAPGRGRGGRGVRAPEGPTPAARGSLLASSGLSEDALREAVVLAVLIRQPGHLDRFLGQLEGMSFATPGHEALRLSLLSASDGADAAALEGHIRATAGPEALENLFASSHLAVVPALQPGADPELAELCVAEELAKLSARRGLEAELAEAVQDLGDLADEGITWRLGQAAEARNRAEKSQVEDKAEYDIGPNGARLRRAERTAFSSLLDEIDFGRGGRKSRRPDAEKDVKNSG
ncbi:MAG: DNA primase [Paracoccaceae bacterium]